MEEKVSDQVMKIMTEEWKLPHEMVRSFFQSLQINDKSSLEDLRKITENLLHDLILKEE